MGLIDHFDLSDLKEAYILASVPTYLYRRFRDTRTVETLAQEYSVTQLVEQYKQLPSNNERSLEDVVKLYAVLIAITLFSYREAKAALNQIDLNILEWGKQIAQIHESVARPITRKTIDVPYRPSIGDPRVLHSNSSINTFVLPESA